MRKVAATTVSAALMVLLTIPLVSAADQANGLPASRAADEWVTTQIQAQYFLDPAIKSLMIHVSTLNGIVTLVGQVHTAEERTRAIDIARNTRGVRNVTGNLTVPGEPQPEGTAGSTASLPRPADLPAADTPPQGVPASDGAMLAQIRSSLAADPTLRLLDIDVQVEGGVARLSGDVPDLAAGTRAERLARAVRGVTAVRNDLSVKR